MEAGLTKHRYDYIIYGGHDDYWVSELCPLEEVEDWDEEYEEWTLNLFRFLFCKWGSGNSLKAVCASTLTTRSRSRVSKIGIPSGERLLGPSMSKIYQVKGSTM